jgi:hypothetical protein
MKDSALSVVLIEDTLKYEHNARYVEYSVNCVLCIEITGERKKMNNNCHVCGAILHKWSMCTDSWKITWEFVGCDFGSFV